MYRWIILATLLASLAGCDGKPTIFMSKADRVNAAFALPEELVTARNSLLAALEGGSLEVRRALGAELAQRMEVRALACSSSAGIGRFDGVEMIRRKVGGAGCFREQDAVLAEWIGLRRVTLAMRRPPLSPLTPLPAHVALPAQKEPPAELMLASGANVAAIRSARHRFTVLQVPGGKVYSDFEAPADAYRAALLSPNGRLLAVPIGNSGLKVFDSETGNLLWNTDKYTQVLAWLPEVEATILAARGNSAPQLLDHRNGETVPYAVPVGSANWAVVAPGGSSRVLLGSGTGVALMEHGRSVDGTLSAQPVKDWRLPPPGVTSGVPILMANGHKLLYMSMVNLGWLDLDTNAQGTWTTSAIGGAGFAKLSESQLYLEVRGVQAWQRSPRVFDIDQGTLVAVAGGDADGALQAVPPRSGYARRNANAMSLDFAAAAQGEPQPLDQAIAQAELAQQLAKVQAAEAAGLRMVLPGQPPGLRSVQPPALLRDIPANAKVAVIGVYEGTRGPRGEGARGGVVRVSVATGRAPLVLVLASYEGVTWQVAGDGARSIAAILVSSYEPSTVLGTRAEVHRIGSQYAYKLGSPEYERLKQEIGRYVAAPIQDFQGTYRGRDFSIN